MKIALYLYYTVKHPQIGIGFNDASSLCDGWSSDDLSPEAFRKASLIFKSRQINDEITEFIRDISLRNEINLKAIAAVISYASLPFTLRTSTRTSQTCI